MKRVVVVEDHTLMRQSLLKLIEAVPGFEVVGEAARGDDAIALIGRVNPDLILLDLALPGGDGLEVAAAVRKLAPNSRCMFLTMHDDEASIHRAISLGAEGYVLKTASTDELLDAMKTVSEGGSYLSPLIARRVMDRAWGAPGVHLTDRELEILELLASGSRVNDMAQQLFLSAKTIKNHLTSIYTKLEVQTAAQAVAAAYRRGLVLAKPERANAR